LEAANMARDISEQIFTDSQKIDIGLSAGKQNLVDLLNTLRNNAGIDDASSRVSLKGGGKNQARLANAFNLAKANEMHAMIHEDSGIDDSKLVPQLRAFAAARNPVANRFINRAHLNDQKRLLSKSQLCMVLWDCLGVDLKVATYQCMHCNQEQCTYSEHAETCRKSRKNITSDNKITHPTRSSALHTEGKRLLAEHLRMAADIYVGQYEPICEGHFGYTDEWLAKSTTQKDLQVKNHAQAQVDLGISTLGEPSSQQSPSCADPHAPDPLPRHVASRADLLVRLPVGPGLHNFLIDFTVSGIHTKVATKHAFINNTEDRFNISIAEHAKDLKDKCYDRFDHDGHIIGFALDSRGGLSSAASGFVFQCFKRSTPKHPRSWINESMRVSLQKRFLDTLSCLMAKHRALDYIYMGIPSTKRSNGFQHTPTMNVVGRDGNRASTVTNAEAVMSFQQQKRLDASNVVNNNVHINVR